MSSFPIPDGPHNDAWKSLLKPCFAVVDEVRRLHDVEFPIQIGGGSMLLRRYGHRRSRDLDLFVTDARLVRWCSPRLNEVSADLFPDYGEEASAVKLIYAMQEIDIIAVAPVIPDGAVETVNLLGREVLIERPREIVAKKIIYRGRTFQPRDVFDLAAVVVSEPEEAAAILPHLSPTHVRDLRIRLDEIEPILAAELANKVDPLPAFRFLLTDCLPIAREVVEIWRQSMTPQVSAPDHPPGFRSVYARDGKTVAVRSWNNDLGRWMTSNTRGPAKVGPDGDHYFLDDQPLTEAEWRRHPAVLAELGPPKD